MSDIVNIASTRWNRGSGNPADQSVRDMLVEALRRLDAGEINPEHAMFVTGVTRGEDGWFDCRVMQCGSFNGFACLGLLDRAKSVIVHGEDFS